MIELKRSGAVCVLMLRHGLQRQNPSMTFVEASPSDVAEVVAAGNPEITRALAAVGWRKVAPESKTMAEAGAELVHAAAIVQSFLEELSIEEDSEAKEASRIGYVLKNAINNYTDNVASPEDSEGEAAFGYRNFEALRTRTVLPDEIDEDPKPITARDFFDPGAYVVMNKAEHTKLIGERHAARRVVHAAARLMGGYLKERKAGIAESSWCTELNDAIHDWLDATPDDGAKRTTQEFLEARIRKVPAPDEAGSFGARASNGVGAFAQPALSWREKIGRRFFGIGW